MWTIDLVALDDRDIPASYKIYMINFNMSAVMFLIPLASALKALGITSGISSAAGFIFAKYLSKGGGYGNSPQPGAAELPNQDRQQRDDNRS